MLKLTNGRAIALGLSLALVSVAIAIMAFATPVGGQVADRFMSLTKEEVSYGKYLRQAKMDFRHEQEEVRRTTPTKTWWENQGWDLGNLPSRQAKILDVYSSDDSRFHLATAEIDGKETILSLAPAESGIISKGVEVTVFMTGPGTGLACAKT